ncbi:MAG TPA: CHASE4 domain-containing protein, partial [Pseudomonas sp.]|nr:CHASE4 domain-containing protein [Pseudomonas sp.]
MPSTAELARHPGKAVATSSVTRRALLFMAALLLLLFVVASVGLVQIALQQNTRATQQSLFYADKAIQARQKSIVATLSDYAYWGEAYRNLHITVDHEWAYTRQNLGPSLFEDFVYEGVFVVDAQGRTPYAVVNGQRVTSSLQQWLKQDIDELLEQARAQTADEQPVVRFVQIDGQPALLAATGFTTGGDPQVRTLPGPPSLLLFVDLLTPEKLQALGRDFGVDNLRLATDPADAQATPALPLASVGAQPLLLRWEPAQPGRQLLYLILPLLALGGAIFALITWLTLRRAIASAREVDASYASLYASQQALAASEVRFRDVAEAASDWIWEA